MSAKFANPADHSTDRAHLLRALVLARDAAAFASPNPSVGCVLTRPLHGNDTPIAEGAHLYDRHDHAEIAALKAAAAAGHAVDGATAFITLEPCAHQGRTGPCADALIAARIARCVIATVDPNPAVRGEGIARLERAGIAVDLLPPDDPLAIAARRLNDAFAFSIQFGRPFVTLKAALSVDGRLAPAPGQRDANRQPYWLTGPEARQDVNRMRHTSDAILTGVGTVLADDPSLTDRTGLPRRRPLLRVILDSHLRTPPGSRLLRERSPGANDLLLICTEAAPIDRVDALEQAGAEILRLPALRLPAPSLPASRLPASPAARVPLDAVLAALHSRRLLSVFVEGGSRINGELLAAGLADRLVLYFSETELGPGALPFSAAGDSPFALQERLSGITRAVFPRSSGEDVRLAGYLHDPWSSSSI